MSSNKPIKMKLFHADWCHHCVRFMPEWNKMKNNIKAQKNIQFENYEESEIAKLPEKVRTFEDTDVRSFGYPSLVINVSGDEYVFNGPRTSDHIFKSILEKIDD